MIYKNLFKLYKNKYFMNLFYFDIETTGLTPENSELLTIQFQEINQEGYSIAPLIIHKSWETSEKDIVEKIYHTLFSGKDKWKFIPVGFNLIFDFTFLFGKFKKYNLPIPNLSDYLYEKPIWDMKYMVVMLNNMNFIGAKLNNFCNKAGDGRDVLEYHKNNEFDKIEEYIQQETKSFLELFRICKKKLMKKLEE